MLETISVEQFNEWLAYSRIEPWDEARSDLRSAMLATVVAASQGMKRKDGRQLRESDFMPDFRSPAEREREKLEGMIAARARDKLIQEAKERAAKRKQQANGEAS